MGRGARQLSPTSAGHAQALPGGLSDVKVRRGADGDHRAHQLPAGLCARLRARPRVRDPVRRRQLEHRLALVRRRAAHHAVRPGGRGRRELAADGRGHARHHRPLHAALPGARPDRRLPILDRCDAIGRRAHALQSRWELAAAAHAASPRVRSRRRHEPQGPLRDPRRAGRLAPLLVV